MLGVAMGADECKGVRGVCVQVHQLEPDDVVFILWTDRYGKQVGSSVGREVRLHGPAREGARLTAAVAWLWLVGV